MSLSRLLMVALITFCTHNSCKPQGPAFHLERVYQRLVTHAFSQRNDWAGPPVIFEARSEEHGSSSGIGLQANVNAIDGTANDGVISHYSVASSTPGDSVDDITGIGYISGMLKLDGQNAAARLLNLNSNPDGDCPDRIASVWRCAPVTSTAPKCKARITFSWLYSLTNYDPNWWGAEEWLYNPVCDFEVWEFDNSGTGPVRKLASVKPLQVGHVSGFVASVHDDINGGWTNNFFPVPGDGTTVMLTPSGNASFVGDFQITSNNTIRICRTGNDACGGWNGVDTLPLEVSHAILPEVNFRAFIMFSTMPITVVGDHQWVLYVDLFDN